MSAGGSMEVAGSAGSAASAGSAPPGSAPTDALLPEDRVDLRERVDRVDPPETGGPATSVRATSGATSVISRESVRPLSVGAATSGTSPAAGAGGAAFAGDEARRERRAGGAWKRTPRVASVGTSAASSSASTSVALSVGVSAVVSPATGWAGAAGEVALRLTRLRAVFLAAAGASAVRVSVVSADG